MEYSLQNLNKITDLKNLTLSRFVEKLNLIGLEIDDIIVDGQLTRSLSDNDIKLVLKIPANRHDLLNEILLNNELANILEFELYNPWEKLKKNYNFLLRQQYDNFLNYKIIPINSDFNIILNYIVKIDSYKNKSIPTWISNKIGKSFSQPENIIESLISLTTLEWGQSFNTFDTKNFNLTVERLKETQNILFNRQNYNLDKGTIILKNDQNEILSILGLINYSIDGPSFLIEATFYDIDQNTLSLNDVNSNLSYRYFRKSFLINFRMAFQRLLTLIEVVADGIINPTILKNKIADLDLNYSRLLQVKKISFKKILNLENYQEEIFKQANLKIVCSTEDTLYFQIPDFRKDLTREIDIIEEYARFIGYKNFKNIFPEISSVSSIKNQTKKLEFIKQFFLNYSFNEVFSNSLVSEQILKSNSISVQNPLNSELALLRSSLINNLIDIVGKNLRFGISNLKFFEIGRVYIKENNIIKEQEYLSLIFPSELSRYTLNSNVDFFNAKGFIENFLSSFNKESIHFENSDKNNECYHPNKFLKITLDNIEIGHFGEINPKYRKLFSLKQNLYLFELNLDRLNTKDLKSKIKLYKDYSRYPLIVKDLSVVISKNINFYLLKDLILKEIRNLKSINFFDVYFDKNVSDKLSLGIRLEFQSFTKTLINEEIDAELQKILLLLNQNFNAELKL